MSGHSKWHSIRHKKGLNDAKRGKILTRHSKLLMVAGRNDPNPETNATLRAAIQNAKADNVPNSNIDRILKKLSGSDKDAAQFTEQVYEGFGPDGIAFIVTAITDNTNRTTPAVKSTFGKNGGNMGGQGTVMYLFDHVGVLEIDPQNKSEDELFEMAIEAGASDFEYEEERAQIITEFSQLATVRDHLQQKNIPLQKSELQYRCKDPQIVSPAQAEKLERFIEALEELDDVDEVFGGFDVE